MNAAPVSVILITGYLGSGKTTFLNHLLALPSIRDRKLALIINEFGALGIDGQLVRKGDYRRYDLNRGSIFCVCIKTDFIKTLRTIADEAKPDLLLVEATGVADPCDLEAFLDEPGLRGRFDVRASICLVDATHFTRVAPYMQTAQNQLRHADGVVINKTDLVPPGDMDRLADVLAAINPRAPQARVVRGQIPESFLAGLTHTRKAGQPSKCAPSELKAVSLWLPGRVNRDAFMEAVASLGEHLLRMKGFVDFGAGPVLTESVFDRVSEQVAPEGVSANAGLTVITFGLTPDVVRQRFGALAPANRPG